MHTVGAKCEYAGLLGASPEFGWYLEIHGLAETPILRMAVSVDRLEVFRGRTKPQTRNHVAGSYWQGLFGTRLERLRV